VLENREEQSLEQRTGGFVLPKVTKHELVAAETNGQLPVAASSVSTGVQRRHREDALRESAVAMAQKRHGVIDGRFVRDNIASRTIPTTRKEVPQEHLDDYI